MPIRRISVAIARQPITLPSVRRRVAQHPAARKGLFEMRRIDLVRVDVKPYSRRC